MKKVGNTAFTNAMHFPLIENDVLLDGILIAYGKNLLKGKGGCSSVQLKKKLN